MTQQNLEILVKAVKAGVPVLADEILNQLSIIIQKAQAYDTAVQKIQEKEQEIKPTETKVETEVKKTAIKKA